MDVVEKLKRKGISIDIRALSAVAKEYGISELSVFGSAIRNDDRTSSPVRNDSMPLEERDLS